LAQKVEASGLGGHVSFHGYVSHEVVRVYYRQADFVVQAPYSEGFGKVPIEALFHGVIPILSDVDMSSQIVGNGLRGRCFPQNDAESIAAQIMALSDQPAEMASMIRAGRKFAKDFTLEAWQQHIKDMLTASWNIDVKHIDTEV
jgi:glycosyltransferase involved in cell wall biosynthesis